MKFTRHIFLVMIPPGLFACQTTSPTNNTAGRATTYQDPGTRGAVSGIGIESQDIQGMTDQMMRDILAQSSLFASPQPPRVIVDAREFRNESASRLNVSSITNRLRVYLNRASKGRMVFVGRKYINVVERERELKRDGKVDVGTTGLMRKTLGADFRLVGSITSLDKRNTQTGLMSRYSQITFEMLDLESGAIAWSGIYEFEKTAADDIMYR